MIHLYCGDGKGKTTAAIGLAVRAAGRGLPVLFVQFMKNASAGELAPLEKLGVKILRGKCGSHFFSQMTEDEKKETKRLCDENLSFVMQYIHHIPEGRETDGVENIQHPSALLVLDEICAACHYGLIDSASVDSLFSSLPAQVEAVLTGRNPMPLFLEKADYITEMKKIRHPYDRGQKARRGVEF